MNVPPVIIITGMTVCSFVGGLCFKQFSDDRDILWLVAGYSLYSIANVLWILLIDESGIARAIVLASTAQIVLTTLAGIYFGERIGVFGFAAAALACIAGALTFLGPTSPPIQTPETPHTIEEEHVDERSR
ncbi:MAG: hypothetical protein AAF636_20605 [Pseudomonadota bacterium]